MTDPGPSEAVLTTFPILRAVVHDFDHQSTDRLDEVQGALRELEERHGPRAVALCVHTLAMQTLAMMQPVSVEVPESLFRTIDRLERTFLEQRYGNGPSGS